LLLEACVLGGRNEERSEGDRWEEERREIQ